MQSLVDGETCFIAGSSHNTNRLAGFACTPYFQDVYPDGNIDVIAGKLPYDGISKLNSFVILENPYNQLTGMRQNVLKELYFSIQMRGVAADVIPSIARFALALLGLQSREKSDVAWLSGGELQRLHLASALSTRARLVLLDNAFAELDREAVDLFPYLLQKLNQLYESRLLVIDERIGRDAFADAKIGEVFSKSERILTDITLVTQSAKDNKKKTVLEFVNVKFSYVEENAPLLNDFNLQLFSGETVFLLGPNGSGKTTLSRIITGDLPAGSILNGRLSIQDRPGPLRLDKNTELLFGLAPQNPDISFCEPSIFEEMTVGLSADRIDFAKDLAVILGFDMESPQLMELSAFDLDRAARKRLSVFLALRNSPVIAFLDEPTQYQDFLWLDRLAAAMRYAALQGTAILCSTHDDKLIAALPQGRQMVMGSQSLAGEMVTAGDHTNMIRQATCLKSDLAQLSREAWEGGLGEWASAFPGTLANWRQRIYPVLHDLFDRVDFSTSGNNFVDLGCSFGFQTVELRRIIRQAGYAITDVTGVDIDPHALSVARSLIASNANFEFVRADLNQAKFPIELNHLHKSSGLVFSSFVVHDLPNAGNFIQIARSIVREKGKVLLIMLNPSWVEKNWNTKVVGFFDQQDRHDFRAGGFYIVDKHKRVKIPYFHRTIADYLCMFDAYGFDVDLVSTMSNSNILTGNPTHSESFFQLTNDPDAQSLSFVLSVRPLT